jgi:hypothetical protein
MLVAHRAGGHVKADRREPTTYQIRIDGNAIGLCFEEGATTLKVCIVGASGKLGQYMIQHALERGYDVVGCVP